MVWLVALACTSAPVQPPAPRVETLELPAPSEPRYAASQILISWRGAVNAPSSVTRSQAEAEVMAHDLHARAQTDFAGLARQHSDGARGPRGGHLGVYATGTQLPAIERAVASVEVGELAPVTRSPFGWHVLRRDPIEEAEFAHILVSHREADRAASTRSRAEARALVSDLRTRLIAGASFEALARDHSDDASASRGGSLGLVARGAMVQPFEDAAFALDPLGVSDVVETPYGFHLIRRP